ncbi:MAG: hypothetical protein H0W42_11315 [Gemmatimonadaceae bacterium]|nr:hypothetical protein [Gemmatimonadaceae bacterium]
MIKTTFGEMPTEAPIGNFRAVHFPQLARLDIGTVEGMVSRQLSSEGATVRELPRTISFQESDMPGHSGAVPAGSLWSVTVDSETGLLSGSGWLADNEHGHAAELAIVSKSLHHNSIDLGDIPANGVRIVEHGDFWDDDFHVDLIFEKWSLVKTTLVANPAFKDARVEVSDEITAALGLDEPLVVEAPSLYSGHTAVEMVASATALPSWDHFYQAESDIPHKVMLGDADADGWIPLSGNLAQWGKPHTGYDGRSRYAPRSANDYAKFCQPSVLTDRGYVRTGPIVLFGGHVSLTAAADDPRNAWADVRVTDGKHGPWVSGVVRPHVSADDAALYIARASRLSGHWKGDELRMIISCNAEGFPIESYEIAEGELVASFEAPERPLAIPTDLFSFTELSSDAQDRVLAWAKGAKFSNETHDDGSEFTDTEQAERDRIVAEFLAEHT